MLETLRCPVAGYEFEEFIHGIYNAFDERSTLIMLDPFPDERQDRLRSRNTEGSAFPPENEK
ncbi:glucosamine--fructose-6-phosphate aminotransferase [Klebsiella pneumoniae]|nr:glucosamine--fructose-6-phosphate aminotransferase [Klebsiella pneumoniae]